MENDYKLCPNTLTDEERIREIRERVFKDRDGEWCGECLTSIPNECMHAWYEVLDEQNKFLLSQIDSQKAELAKLREAADKMKDALDVAEEHLEMWYLEQSVVRSKIKEAVSVYSSIRALSRQGEGK